mmetsp:Transcript_62934/g.93493  ORF Transcript_62934/g.93493 Transcript_62934/m.93493 type:complete len:81 (+) Transcript_62934:71-313(+)
MLPTQKAAKDQGLFVTRKDSKHQVIIRAAIASSNTAFFGEIFHDNGDNATEAVKAVSMAHFLSQIVHRKGNYGHHQPALY